MLLNGKISTTGEVNVLQNKRDCRASEDTEFLHALVGKPHLKYGLTGDKKVLSFSETCGGLAVYTGECIGCGRRRLSKA